MKCKVMATITAGIDDTMEVEYSGKLHYVKSSATRELKQARKATATDPKVIDLYIKVERR